MVIDQKKLRRAFAFGLLGFYAFGVGFTFHYKTNCEYIRYLQDNVSRMRMSAVSQNRVVDQYNSLRADQTPIENDRGDNVYPYISYSIKHDANNYYSVGEVYFCFIDEDDFDNHFNDVYLDYGGGYAVFGTNYMDVGDFQYNSNNYNIIEFLTTLSADQIYSYGTLYQYGYTGYIDYDVNESQLRVGLSFAFKEPSATSWTFCSLFALTLNNITYLGEDAYYSFNNYSYLNSVLTSNLNFSTNSLNNYQNGINEVLAHPSDYGLYTLQEYLNYGIAQYNQGLEDGSNVLSMSGVMNSIFSAPITMFMQIFNSAPFTWTMPTGEVLDIGGLMTFFLTIGIALAIVKLIMRVGGK